jgi:hypothetical protein
VRVKTTIKEYQMKKLLYKSALAFTAVLMALASIGCTKSIPEVEPNNTERTAQVIQPGVTVKGSFATDDDEDYYKITLTSSGKLTAYTEGAGDVYILWIEELDEDGDYDGLLAEGEYISGNEGDKRVEADLAAGTYCLYLEGYDAGPYSLKTGFAGGR